MATCELCGKQPQFGNNVPRSLHKTKRQWKPNIQRVTVVMEGQRKRMKVCGKCLRTIYRG